MLGAFGGCFLDHDGASIATQLDDGRILSLARRGLAAVVSVTGSTGAPATSWSFDDVEAAIDAWLGFEAPAGAGQRRTG